VAEAVRDVQGRPGVDTSPMDRDALGRPLGHGDQNEVAALLAAVMTHPRMRAILREGACFPLFNCYTATMAVVIGFLAFPIRYIPVGPHRAGQCSKLSVVPAARRRDDQLWFRHLRAMYGETRQLLLLLPQPHVPTVSRGATVASLGARAPRMT
jgi:hypothetical protein